jgi:tetratricopeptide (TPR) repeat protein
VLGNALDVSGSLPSGAPERQRIPGLVAAAKRILADDSLPILADDRSSLYEIVVEALAAQGDANGSKQVARAWSAFLEAEAGRAATPETRVVFDAHRLSAYLELGEEAKAIEMLSQSERDFPDDYNPPARLARAYFQLKQYDRALAAIDRALPRIYGPRAMRVLALKADICQANGDREGARAALRQALGIAARVALPASYGKLRDQLRARLDALEKPNAF